MIPRSCSPKIQKALESMPVVAILGSRQVGKTTLALALSKKLGKKSSYFDLESDLDYNKFTDAEAFLKRFSDELVIIDEVQRKPDLFRVLRCLVDERKRNGEKSCQFLLLGSASRDLFQFSSESLAERIRYIELTPFTINEVKSATQEEFDLEKIWFRGGYPDSYLAIDEEESWEWRNDFIATYIERDIPSMGVGVSPTHLKRFWKMLAHYNGNQVVYSELGRSLELSHTTIKNYLDVLTDFYMVRQLNPWSGNIKKRLVKSPKIYLRDTGILHNLLQVSSMNNLLSHPAIGASWESFVIENIIRELDNRWEYFYYRTATQVEIDLILHTPNQEVWAIEIKRARAPKLSRGFYEACEDVGATHRWVITANDDRYPLPKNIEVIGIVEFLSLLKAN